MIEVLLLVIILVFVVYPTFCLTIRLLCRYGWLPREWIQK